MIEERIVELAKRGGWHEGIDREDQSLPAWQRRGFSWTWHENGDLELVHRVPGKKLLHGSCLETQNRWTDVAQDSVSTQRRRKGLFSTYDFSFEEKSTLPYSPTLQSMSTRYTNAVVKNTFEPPHTFKNEDGSEGIAVPPHVRSHFALSAAHSRL